MQYRYATEADVPSMAALFAANHRDALSERQRSEQGFVQGSFGADALLAMVRSGSLFVADPAATAGAADSSSGESESRSSAPGRVAGLLALSAPESVSAPPPPVRALLDAQDSLRWQGQPLSESRWLLYGPVVVDTAFRGQGVAKGLFTMAVESAWGRADAVVAFIEADNRPSWRVHVDGFGMRPLGEYVAGGRTYHAIAAPAREAAR
ncbi:GNAT family N-acetyltransferase [Streptomyces sp. NPDC059398]|uniref:GNAT family N-acetyltransferase n=1 Tax=Streptomyces sp. NPDC059398 TaxID=3346820 RepID=UPI00367BEAC1